MGGMGGGMGGVGVCILFARTEPSLLNGDIHYCIIVLLQISYYYRTVSTKIEIELRFQNI